MSFILMQGFHQHHDTGQSKVLRKWRIVRNWRRDSKKKGTNRKVDGIDKKEELVQRDEKRSELGERKRLQAEKRK